MPPRKRKEYFQKYRATAKGKEIIKRASQDYHKKMREKLFAILGMTCCCNGINCKHHISICGISDLRILQFEHINGDADNDKKRFKSRDSMIKYYVDHPKEAEERLQIYCVNCNWVKRYVNKEYI